MKVSITYLPYDLKEPKIGSYSSARCIPSRQKHTRSLSVSTPYTQDFLIYLFYFPASTTKAPYTLAVVSLDIPVLDVDILGIFLWELRLQLVGEVVKSTHTVLCGLRKETGQDFSDVCVNTLLQVWYYGA